MARVRPSPAHEVLSPAAGVLGGIASSLAAAVVSTSGCRKTSRSARSEVTLGGFVAADIAIPPLPKRTSYADAGRTRIVALSHFRLVGVC